MRFDEYIKFLGARVSKVKAVILERLWNEGESFPRGWVRSSELLSLTGQKYFDRRVRELRDEFGCDIETGTSEGEHAYRLLSTRVENANPRAYLSSAQKDRVFEMAGYTCAVCGRKFDSEARGLQADHKVPLTRGGGHEYANWQPLCVVCNVGKRRACAGCDLDCKQCPWAFPEMVGRRVVLSMPFDLEQAAREQATRTGVDISEMIIQSVRSALGRQNP
jgi:hypothetical protein